MPRRARYLVWAFCFAVFAGSAQTALAQGWTVIIDGRVGGDRVLASADLSAIIVNGTSYSSPEGLATALGGRATVDRTARTITIVMAAEGVSLSPFPEVGRAAEIGERYEAGSSGSPFTFAFVDQEYHPSRCVDFPDGSRISLCNRDEQPVPLMLVRYRIGNIGDEDLVLNNSFARFTVVDVNGHATRELGYQRVADTHEEAPRLLPGQEIELVKFVDVAADPEPSQVLVELRGHEERLRYEIGGAVEDPLPGDYRVTVTGFQVVRQTEDDPLNRDGCGDEVFVRTDVWRFRGDGFVEGMALETPTIGDRNHYPDRLRGGSGNATACPSFDPPDGGLLMGDQYPPPNAREIQGTPTRDALPLVVHQGSIEDDELIVIMPTLWEWDGDGDLHRDVAAEMPDLPSSSNWTPWIPNRAPTGNEAIDGSVDMAQFLWRHENNPPYEWRIMSQYYYAGGPDRPVGRIGHAVQGSLAFFFTYAPRAIFLTRESADRVIDRGGLITFEYRAGFGDTPEEHYRLFVRVERF